MTRLSWRPLVLWGGIALLLMVCCCWPVFTRFDLHVREGFVVWDAGMVLALSSIDEPRLSDTGGSAS